MGEETLRAISKLDTADASKELKSTVIDFSAMSFLALYHAVKTKAAVNLKLFYETRDIGFLKKAYCRSKSDRLLGTDRFDHAGLLP